MKIAGAVIQNRFIEKNTESDFIAIYKNRTIEISTNHGHGKAELNHLKRFDIVVYDHVKSGMYDVNTWKDLHNIKDAIRYALKGACLIP